VSIILVMMIIIIINNFSADLLDVIHTLHLIVECFDAVGWAAGRAFGL